MTTGAHVLAISITALALLFLMTLLRRGHLRAKYVMLWLPIGIGMLVFASVPGLLDSVAGFVGVAYPPALVFMLAIMLLLLVCMHFSWELSRIEERLRILAESVALQESAVAESRESERISAVGE